MRKRLPSPVIAADRAVMTTLQDLSDYAPRNPEFSIDSMRETEANLSRLEREERILEEQLAALRDQLAAEGHRYHDKLQGGKNEVTLRSG